MAVAKPFDNSGTPYGALEEQLNPQDPGAPVSAETEASDGISCANCTVRLDSDMTRVSPLAIGSCMVRESRTRLTHGDARLSPDGDC